MRVNRRDSIFGHFHNPTYANDRCKFFCPGFRGVTSLYRGCSSYQVPRALEIPVLQAARFSARGARNVVGRDVSPCKPPKCAMNSEQTMRWCFGQGGMAVDSASGE